MLKRGTCFINKIIMIIVGWTVFFKKNLFERDVHLLMEIVTDGRLRISYIMCYGFVLLLFYLTIDDTDAYTNIV